MIWLIAGAVDADHCQYPSVFIHALAYLPLPRWSGLAGARSASCCIAGGLAADQAL